MFKVHFIGCFQSRGHQILTMEVEQQYVAFIADSLNSLSSTCLINRSTLTVKGFVRNGSTDGDERTRFPDARMALELIGHACFMRFAGHITFLARI
jgi:hypothetical protein